MSIDKLLLQCFCNAFAMLLQCFCILALCVFPGGRWDDWQISRRRPQTPLESLSGAEVLAMKPQQVQLAQLRTEKVSLCFKLRCEAPW